MMLLREDITYSCSWRNHRWQRPLAHTGWRSTRRRWCRRGRKLGWSRHSCGNRHSGKCCTFPGKALSSWALCPRKKRQLPQFAWKVRIASITRKTHKSSLGTIFDGMYLQDPRLWQHQEFSWWEKLWPPQLHKSFNSIQVSPHLQIMEITVWLLSTVIKCYFKVSKDRSTSSGWNHSHPRHELSLTGWERLGESWATVRTCFISILRQSKWVKPPLTVPRWTVS